MDAAGFRIVAEVLRNPFASNEAVGRKVGLSGTAVRQRLERLGPEMNFRGFRLLPSPALLGRVARGYFFQASPDDVDPEAVLAADDVVWLVSHHEPLLSVLAFQQPEDAGPPAGLAAAVGREPVSQVELRLTAAASPPVPSPLDWRILQGLLEDPRQSASDLAKATGLSRRTVARRREQLVRGGSAYVSPLWDEARAAGGIVYHLVAIGGNAESLRAAVPDALPFATLTRPPGVAMVAHASSAAEAVAQANRLRRLADDVHLNFPMGNRFAHQRVRAWLEAESAKWQRARPAARRAG